MSLNDFSDRARLNIKITISGQGQFDPFGTGNPLTWTLEGEVTALPASIDLTVKEKTCLLPYGSPKEFRRFSLINGVGSTSGFIDTGILPKRYSAETVVGPIIGEWTVNTSPVIGPNGTLDGEPAPRGALLVKQAVDKKIDDPITLTPPIDYVGRVYAGDLIYTSGTGSSQRWYVSPQRRLPKPDRTFDWVPNTAPILAAGGIANGERVKPGTVMLPTADYYIEQQSDSFDGMRYFYAGQGVLFDGQVWSKELPDPIVYEPENAPKEFRNINVGYISDQLYPRLLEEQHRNKPFVFTNQTIDDSKKVVYTVTQPENPYTVDLIFRWNSPENNAEANIQPSVPGLMDFGDAWTNYHKANRQWLMQKFPGSFLGAGFTLTDPNADPPLVWSGLGVEAFVDGNITVIEDKIQVEGVGELTNRITITVQAIASLA